MLNKNSRNYFFFIDLKLLTFHTINWIAARTLLQAEIFKRSNFNPENNTKEITRLKKKA